jgi:mannose-1-phosphate guanylyltransferase
MAGGVGSRFWPASTSEKPKQFLDILGAGKSLIEMTIDRCLKLVAREHIYIVTNKKYQHLIEDQLPDFPAENILYEPSMNNTAPCIAYTALRIQSQDSDAVLAVLPSDHVILKEDEFVKILDMAFDAAYHKPYIVTMGIRPTRPDTGYGYICYENQHQATGDNSIFKVTSFREKPDAETAVSYISSGNYLWNAGMFVWHITTLLDAFKINAPDILDILHSKPGVFGTPEEQQYIDQVYPSTRSVSVDYAILEKADNVYTIPADIGWSDLGTWNSLYTYLSGGTGNVEIGSQIHLIDSDNVIVVSNNPKKIVIKGLQDYIIVDEPNALLIYPKSAEQEIKEVVKNIGA